MRAGFSASGAYLLALVALVCVLQQMDKFLFSVALEPIRLEFNLSDTQLGVINGVAFALCFAIAGIPIARMAERRGRKPVIALSLAAWSAFTAATGLATGFISLFVSRVLVGVGESGCGPAVQSLIAARFSQRQRSGAMSIVYSAGFLGTLLGLALGGFLVSATGWRHAFVIMGSSGLLLAPLVWFTLEDPQGPAAAADATAVGDLAAVLRSPGVPDFMAMFCLMGLPANATLMWAPAFYSRIYGSPVAQTDAWLGVVIGGGAIAGSLTGGMIVNRLTAKRKDAAPSFVLWTTMIAAPASIGAFVVNDRLTSLALLFVSVLASCLPAGPIFALLHDLVYARLRAIAAALAAFAGTVVGGIGPLAVGFISDLVGRHSHEGLRVALVAINIANALSLIPMARLLRTHRRIFAGRSY